LAALLQDVGVDHGRGQIVVPEQLLNGADVGAALEQVRGEGMAKGVGADGLRQAGTSDGPLDGFVDDAGVHVMATGDTRTRVYGDVPSREDILPALFFGGVRRLSSHRGVLVVDFLSRRHRRFAPWRPEIADNRHRAKLPENRSNITLSRQIVKLINGSAAIKRRPIGECAY
jgi:hypothetical protein